MDDVSLPRVENKHGDMNYELDFMHKVLSRLLVKKSPQWKHKQNCLINAAKGFIRNFMIAYGIKLGGQLLMMLVKNKLNFMKVLKNAKSGDSLGFALFLSGLTALFKITLCFTRRINRTHDHYNAAIAGVICSLAWIADRNVSRRQGIIFYLSARIFESALKLMDNHKVMDEPKEWGFYAMYAWSILFIYQIWCERDTALKSVLKTADKFGWLGKNEMTFIHILHNVSF